MRTTPAALGPALAFSLVLASSPLARAQLPVVPGLVGFGAETPAGRGGDVYRVTTLADSGAGSLRECVEASGPRVCVFEVGGEIVTQSAVRIDDPFLTIAGQSAPSPGITIRGGQPFWIMASDVLVQHLRFRAGDDPDGHNPDDRDCLTITAPSGGTVERVIIDHVSMALAIDENTSVWSDGGTIRDVTYREVIVAYGLRDSLHSKGTHSMGLLIGRNSQRTLVVGSLFAHNYNRNPLVRDDVRDVIVLDNLVYNPGMWESRIQMGTRGPNDLPLSMSVVGNVLIPGADTNRVHQFIHVDGDHATGSRLYVHDNLAPERTDDWSVVAGSGSSVRWETPPIWIEGLSSIGSAMVEERVLDCAGARPLDRDSLDVRAVTSVRDRSDLVPNCVAADGTERCERNVGGYPVLAESHRALALPDAPHADDDGDGYTNLEEFLHAEARALECGGVVVPTEPEHVFSPVPYLGDRRNFDETAASRWGVVADQGDLRYAIVTSDYEAGSGERLGEIALVRDRLYDELELEVTLRTAEVLSSDTAADADIVFGYQGPDDYLYVMLNTYEGLTGLFRVAGGVREELATYDAAGIPDTDYHAYTVTHREGRLVVARDGAVLLDEALAPVRGRIGIGSLNDAVFFDDLSAHDPSAPEPDPDAGVPETPSSDGAMPMVPAVPDAGDEDPGEVVATGCGCRAAPRDSRGALLSLALAALVVVRRRRVRT